MIKNNFRAFRRQLRCRRRAFARQSSAILACGLLATIPNALLSCKASEKINNSGIQAANSAKNTAVTENTEIALSQSDSIENTASAGTINLDLTKMSATMIYSTIFDMLIMPEDYVEKNIKVKGWFETYMDTESGELYYAVLVPDATACCQQGLEFVWKGNHTYPDDFPKPGQDITVTGIYKMIETDGVTYTYLEANSVEF